MTNITIWHNPRCSKSRQTLALLEEKGITPTIRLYLSDTPTDTDIRQALSALDLEPRDLMRTKETDYKDQGLAEITDPSALIAAMVNTPKLIERPIVFNGDKAAIGRPPEQVLEIL